MQRSLNRKSVGIIQFIKKYDISSIKKTTNQNVDHQWKNADKFMN